MNNFLPQPYLRFSLFAVFLGFSMLLISCQEDQTSGESGPAVPLIPEALGDLSLPVSTDNEKAQAYFDQGLQLGYAFNRGNAIGSFIEAQEIDSTCAMCYWGEAWTKGPYLNNQDKVLDGTFNAISKAVKLSEQGHTNDLETALIRAMEERYNEFDNLENRAELDTTYAKAMEQVYQTYPEHPEVATLYAEALFLLEPRSEYRDINDPDVQHIVQVLDKSLEQNGKHAGLCHFYIHILEATDQPEKALSCAEYIGDSIPGASHINHMPSHIYNRTGDWGKSVEANINAWHTDQKAELDKAFAIYPGHNLHMLVYAASMDGQGAIAIQAGKDFAKMTGNNMYQALALIRFGRFDEVLELSSRPAGDIPGGIWDFAQGYTHLKVGNIGTARNYLEDIKQTAEESEASYRGQQAEDLLGTVGFILEGEILREEKELNMAVETFNKAVVRYDELPYSEPETLPFSPRHWLGSVLLDMGEYSRTEEVYREQLEHHPNNGWSLYGLIESLEGQQKTTEKVEKEFKASWQRSDTWIQGARF